MILVVKEGQNAIRKMSGWDLTQIPTSVRYGCSLILVQTLDNCSEVLKDTLNGCLDENKCIGSVEALALIGNHLCYDL